MSEVLDIIQNPTLTYHQQLLALARLAENKDTTLQLNPEFVQGLKDKTLCDLGEGSAPYRPRYIVPDYDLLMKKGCKFLELEPAKDIWEACNNLLIFYRHVPSVTSFPVYLGNFSELFAPFDKDENETRKALELFLKNIDKTLCDSFVHADIGPGDNRVTRIILELTKKMQLAVPNLTLLYDKDLTPKELALASIDCMMATSKPSFANHKIYAKEHPNGRYAIVSCYNALRIGGGGYTLPRMRLYEISLKAKDVDDFFANVLPHYCDILLDDIDRRIKFIVEESNFFTSNFLVTEGFVERENFTGMFGIVGVAECVNHLLGIEDKAKGFGHDEQANKLAEKVLDTIHDKVAAHKGLYCSNCNNMYVMHAQVGIDSDGMDDSPGCRVPIGFEPELYQHILLESKVHKHFVSGVGDIFKLDSTWNDHKEALLDIINGAMDSGMRYFTAYSADNDVVRVTGYLVKRSEIEKLNNNKTSLNNCSAFGQGASKYGHALDRRVYDNSGH